MTPEPEPTYGAAPARRSVLVEAAVATLDDAGRPMSLQQLARAVLHVDAGGAHIAARILAPLLESDARLTTVAVGHWGLTQWSHRTDAIDETEFVVFDIETNGGRGGRHRVLEVGALRLRAGQEVARYASLVWVPGRVSKFVTRYTGITDEMLTDAPAIETVLDEFREFQAGGVLVAHNLPTDLGYLNREAVWSGRALFPGDGLDTMELSAALMSDLPGTGLATVLEAAGIRDTPAHRALDDAGVTAKLFRFLLDRAAASDARTLDDLRGLAATGGPEGRHPRRARELARWASRNLPPSPGVYIFRDSAGQPLYVGKSTSLQRRVRSHFTDSAGFVRRRDGMLEQIEAIEWEPTGSELRALVREAELITALSPSYNVHRHWRMGRRFVRVGPAESAATHTAAVPGNDSADYLGPFQTSRDAQLASDAVRRIFELPSRRSLDKKVSLLATRGGGGLSGREPGGLVANRARGRLGRADGAGASHPAGARAPAPGAWRSGSGIRGSNLHGRHAGRSGARPHRQRGHRRNHVAQPPEAPGSTRRAETPARRTSFGTRRREQRAAHRAGLAARARRRSRHAAVGPRPVACVC